MSLIPLVQISQATSERLKILGKIHGVHLHSVTT